MGLGLRAQVELGQRGDCQLGAVLPCNAAPRNMAVILILRVCRKLPRYCKWGQVLLLREDVATERSPEIGAELEKR